MKSLAFDKASSRDFEARYELGNAEGLFAQKMFRPPVNRAMRQLDRSFFTRDCLVSAARILESRNIAKIRNALMKSNDLLVGVRTIPTVVPDPSPVEGTGCGNNRRCVILNEKIKYNDPTTWSATLTQLSQANEVTLIPYELHLNYSHWSAYDILGAILPEQFQDDLPTGFNAVGHVAHFNLQEKYQPYKHLIGQVTIDKNPTIETVINKVEKLDKENEFRVLDFELLAGRPDYNVEVSEANSRFQFDFSKVYWNTRLNTEHVRLAEKFKAGEAVCDAMAGVGPFAIPAGRSQIFVWANDLNPDCYTSLNRNIGLNKVEEFVSAFCEDAHNFIKAAAERLIEEDRVASVPLKVSRLDRDKGAPTHNRIHQPRTFSHYVMNLPASAIDFLPDFKGLYAGHEELFEPVTRTKLPMIHCYCFGPKADEEADNIAAKQTVCKQMSEKIGCAISLHDPETDIYDVRDVAPNKRQFCASFRLPPEVAFWKQNAVT